MCGNGKRLKAQVGIGGLYVRKWEKAESACRNRRSVHAENGKRLKAQVGISKWYVRKAGRGENRR